MLVEDLFKLTEVALGVVTVIRHLAESPVAFLAVITAVPAFIPLTVPSETVAMEESDVAQVTSWSDPAGLIVAANDKVESISTQAVVSESVMEVGLTPFTKTVQEAVIPLTEVAVIVALPLDLAATVPLETLATDESEVDQTIVGSAFVGVTRAESVSVSSFHSSALVRFSEIDETSGRVTVTSQVAVLPFSVVAVIFAVPGATAVIVPSETVATESLEEVQVTVCGVVNGYTVAVSVVVRLTCRSTEDFDSVTS